MSEFERELPPFRLVQTHHGDDLGTVATRELGDANRWPELVWLNDLLPPYLTDDESAASQRVLLNGTFIRVPAPAGRFLGDDDSVEQTFGRDCGMWGRRMAADADGDIAAVSGADNLVQQLRHAIITPRGQQKRHSQYGCLVWRLHGTANGPLASTLGSEYVRATLAADYRVNTVKSSIADVSGDQVRVTARVETIAGDVIDVGSDEPNFATEDPTPEQEFGMHVDLLHEFVHFTLPPRLRFNP
ncbi:phage baseplate assembly protein W [Microvirga lupini]|uniref:Phage baseplate assembly protein W n=1 Tax=Microvirga lupini TaxID=420324 RepID=A0A7W4YUT8_9HYPH|nr:hypothetical protein [Microvirga lupini]MBB3017720.1 phage baseplate assembly protein W [Microvirga lupini]